MASSLLGMGFPFVLVEVVDGLANYGAHHREEDGPAAAWVLPDALKGGERRSAEAKPLGFVDGQAPFAGGVLGGVRRPAVTAIGRHRLAQACVKSELVLNTHFVVADFHR
jgi:hypothetical protein